MTVARCGRVDERLLRTDVQASFRWVGERGGRTRATSMWVSVCDGKAKERRGVSGNPVGAWGKDAGRKEIWVVPGTSLLPGHSGTVTPIAITWWIWRRFLPLAKGDPLCSSKAVTQV